MGLSDSLRATWEHRRDLGGLWWRFLAKLGLSKDRFHEWKPWQQRAGKVALAGVLAFLLSMFVNTLEHFFGSTRGLDPDLRPLRLRRLRRDRADRHSRVGGAPRSRAPRGRADGGRRRYRRRRDRRVRDRQHAQRGDRGRRDVHRALRAAVAQPPGNGTDADPGTKDAGRPEGRPADRDRPRDHVPVLRGQAVHDPRLRAGAVGRHGGEHDRVHDDGRRPEHRRRLRGPARPRLRRLLRDWRVHRRLVRVAPVPDDQLPSRRGRHRQEPARDPHHRLGAADRSRHSSPR